MANGLPDINYAQIDAFLNNATSTLKGLQTQLAAGVTPTAPAFAADLHNYGSTVSTANTALSDGLTAVISSVTNAVSNEVNAVENAVKSIGTGIGGTLNSLYDSVSTLFSDLRSQIFAESQRTLQLLTSGWQTLQADFSSSFNFVAQDLVNGLNGIGSSIARGIADAISTIAGPLEAIGAQISSGIGAAVSGIEQVVQTVPAALETVVQDAAKSIEAIGTTIGQVATAVGSITNPEQLLKNLGTFIGAQPDFMLREFGQVVTPFAEALLKGLGLENNVLTSDDYRKLIEVAGAEALIGLIPFPLDNVGFIFSRFVNNIADGLLAGAYRDIAYSGNLTSPNRILDLTTELAAYFRGLRTFDELKGNLAKDGFSGELAGTILEASYELLQATTLVQLRFRGVIASDEELDREVQALGFRKGESSRMQAALRPLFGPGQGIEMWRRQVLSTDDKDFFDDLRREGWTEARIEALKKISYVVPNPETLRQFIIHQADDDAVAQKFGLDEGIDEAFFTRAAATGWTREDARRLYRSSWVFPPFFILESLYKSGEITKEDFTTIMKFTGIPSFFISSFASSLAPKLSTADVKDMYKFQVIGADQIVPELAKIGISGDLAVQLKTLWVASTKLASPLDQTGAQAATAKTKELSQATVLAAYADGVIPEAKAIALLEEAKFDPDEANLLVQIEKYKLQQKDIADQVTVLEDAIRAGDLGFDDAVIKLQALQLTDLQYAKYYEAIKRLVVRKPNLPTLADLKEWLKKGAITLADFVAGMRTLGWKDGYIANFLVADGVGPADIQTALST